MQIDILNTIGVAFGLYMLVGVTLKPGFYWERPRIQQLRELIGDRRAAIVHFLLGLVLITVGVLDMFGRLVGS